MGEEFNMSNVQDLEDDLEVYWKSDPQYGKTNDWFWSHEWKKHGTCSGLDQHDYFQVGLALREKYAHLCTDASEWGTPPTSFTTTAGSANSSVTSARAAILVK